MVRQSRDWARRLTVALALGSLLMWTAQVPAGAAPAGQAGDGEVIEDSQPAPVVPQAAAFNRAALIDGVIQVSNAERAKVGAPPLTANEQLMRAAQDYAAVLAPGPCFEHTCQPVPALRDRVTNARYPNPVRIGENIAAGDPTAAEVVAGWMNSPGHRANILNPEFREIGVGVLTGAGEFGIYWVQVFGTRQG
jgi:uncharacterized protein YkwD